jgi:hypothetical protein
MRRNVANLGNPVAVVARLDLLEPDFGRHTANRLAGPDMRVAGAEGGWLAWVTNGNSGHGGLGGSWRRYLTGRENRGMKAAKGVAGYESLSK